MTTFFLSHLSLWISTFLYAKLFPVYFPKLSHHITLIIPIFSLFGKKIHNFLWQIEHKEWKYKYHSFGNGYNSLIFRRKFYESMSFWFWKYVFYSSRIFRRARRQFVVGFNEVILPYHHNRMYSLCIPIQWKYTISNLNIHLCKFLGVSLLLFHIPIGKCLHLAKKVHTTSGCHKYEVCHI